MIVLKVPPNDGSRAMEDAYTVLRILEMNIIEHREEVTIIF
jgi:hypothetical protein